MTATNPAADPVRGAVVWIYMPVRSTATQVLEGLSVSAPHQVQGDALGHSILRLGFADVPPLASRVVSITAQVRLVPQPVPQALPDARAWLGPQRYIEVDDPAVQACAALLRRADAAATAGAIFEWVRRNLQYAGYVADDLGARAALATRRGDCTEYAYLAAALARANGIAARVVGGYVAPVHIAPRPEEYHNWTEVHVDGAWRTLDAQKEHWYQHPDGYVAFRIDTGRDLNPIGLAHRFKVQGDLQVRF